MIKYIYKTFSFLFFVVLLIGTSCNKASSSSVQRNEQAPSSVATPIDENAWLYGTWRCNTPYGTIELILQENGRMYDSIEEKWQDYSIEGDRIIEYLNGGISAYNIDRANKRFDAGRDSGSWFYKVSD